VAKRHLPLLQPTAEGDSDGPPRPAWQWVAFGALAIFAVWVPLSALGGSIAARFLSRAQDADALTRAAILTSAGYAIELAAGALAGGYLVGKWGPPHVGIRQAALAGLTAAGALALATWTTLGPTPGLVLVALIAPPMAAVGARLGRRRPSA
jgi:peptidoglycan/LPS O-acetylase OafA/YrhL